MNKIHTAKQIADDVQQTFEEVSNSYRGLLEKRIIDYGNARAQELFKAEKERIMKEIEKLVI